MKHMHYFRARAAQAQDTDALLSLISTAAPWIYTLPHDFKAIANIIAKSQTAFATPAEDNENAAYLFVLENCPPNSPHTIKGIAIIAARAGMTGHYFSFERNNIEHASHTLGLRENVNTLTLSPALHYFSQFCSFYVHESVKSIYTRQLLSYARLIFAQQFPDRFSENFFSALPGQLDEFDDSPFWQAIGQHFFKTSFIQAENLVEGSRNRSLILEVMPHYPIYTILLPTATQAVLGKVHPKNICSQKILLAAGFAESRYIDLFDAGPIYKMHASTLQKRFAPQTLICQFGTAPLQINPMMVCKIRYGLPLITFVTHYQIDGQTITLDISLQFLLELNQDESVQLIPLPYESACLS